MGALARLLITLSAIFVLLGVPAANAGQRSDAKAFAKAQATWQELDAAFIEAYSLYEAAVTGTEKSTARNDVERVVAGAQDTALAMETRPCFRPWWRALVGFYDGLVAALKADRAGAVMNPAEQARAGLYLGALRSPDFAALFVCRA